MSFSFGGCFSTQFFSIVTFNVLAAYPFDGVVGAQQNESRELSMLDIASSSFLTLLQRCWLVIGLGWRGGGVVGG